MATRLERQGAPPVLGVDVGGVLVDRAAEGSDTSFFGSDPMSTPMVPDAFAAVATLAPLFGWRVHVISKAGPKISALTREWLARHEFFALTGVSPSNLHFVRKRHEKAPVCAQLGVTHFVDDRLDVLEHLEGVVEHRILFLGGLGLNTPPQTLDSSIREIVSWADTVRSIEQSLVAPPT